MLADDATEYVLFRFPQQDSVSDVGRNFSMLPSSCCPTAPHFDPCGTQWTGAPPYHTSASPKQRTSRCHHYNLVTKTTLISQTGIAHTWQQSFIFTHQRGRTPKHSDRILGGTYSKQTKTTVNYGYISSTSRAFYVNFGSAKSNFGMRMPELRLDRAKRRTNSLHAQNVASFSRSRTKCATLTVQSAVVNCAAPSSSAEPHTLTKKEPGGYKLKY